MTIKTQRKLHGKYVLKFETTSIECSSLHELKYHIEELLDCQYDDSGRYFDPKSNEWHEIK